MDADTLAHRRFDLGAAGELTTDALIHQYPGKRALFRGTLAGQDVVAKFYLLPVRTAWEWWRGARGARALRAVGLPSPAVRFAGFERGSGCWLTVVDWIDADAPWPPPRNPLAPEIHEQLLQTLAAHHEAGVVQSDLNWANFIPRDGVLHSIDGDRVRRFRAPLPWRRARGNLLRLYGSKTHFDEGEIRWGWMRYCALRGFTISENEAWEFVAAVQFRRRYVAERVAHRKLHGWKHFVRERRNGWLVVADGQRLGHDARKQLAGAAGAMDGEADTPEGHEITIDVPNAAAVRVRAHRGMAMPVLYAWRQRPTPTRAWIHAATAARMRLPVERPLALLETRTVGLRRHGHLVSLQRAHSSLRDALTSGGADPDRALEEIGALVERLETARMTHHLTLDRLGWDGDSVILLDAGGLQLLPRWRFLLGQTTSVNTASVARDLALVLGRPEEEVAARLRPAGGDA